jgi:hypothetical protein
MNLDGDKLYTKLVALTKKSVRPHHQLNNQQGSGGAREGPNPTFGAWRRKKRRWGNLRRKRQQYPLDSAPGFYQWLKIYTRLRGQGLAMVELVNKVH